MNLHITYTMYTTTKTDITKIYPRRRDISESKFSRFYQKKNIRQINIWNTIFEKYTSRCRNKKKKILTLKYEANEQLTSA